MPLVERQRSSSSQRREARGSGARFLLLREHSHPTQTRKGGKWPVRQHFAEGGCARKSQQQE
jgi:hypothetical protein